MLKTELLVDASGEPVLDRRGNPQFHYTWTGDGSGEDGVLMTGPNVEGIITLSDGTKYDVTPNMIEHAAGHAGPICHHIEKQLEVKGHFKDTYGDTIGHTCTDFCGSEHDGSVFVNKFVRDALAAAQSFAPKGPAKSDSVSAES